MSVPLIIVPLYFCRQFSNAKHKREMEKRADFRYQKFVSSTGKAQPNDTSNASRSYNRTAAPSVRKAAPAWLTQSTDGDDAGADHHNM